MCVLEKAEVIRVIPAVMHTYTYYPGNMLRRVSLSLCVYRYRAPGARVASAEESCAHV